MLRGRTSRGQASLEQLIITALGIGLVAIIFYISFNYALDSIRVAQARDSVDRIAGAADTVYLLGPGSIEIVDVQFPDGIRFINTSGNRIWLRVSLPSGDADVYANTRAEIVGAVTTSGGRQRMTLTATENGKVQIGSALLTCSPSSITKNIAQNGSGSDSIAIMNVADYQLVNISALLSGNIGDMTTLTQPGTTLNPGASDSVGLAFAVASGKAVGTYSGTVTVSGSNSSECSTHVTISVTRQGGADTQGPVVTGISSSPKPMHATNPATITATGDDTTTGNSNVYMCQVQADYSGIWNNMAASDGSYDSPVENVTYTFGTFSQGAHNIRVRCMDSEGNMGGEYSYTLIIVKKDIVFITLSAAPSAGEQKWLTWITTHTSGAGFAWDIDQVSRSAIGSTTNLSDYGIAVLPDAPNADVTLYANLNSYKTTNYVVLLGTAMKFAMDKLGAGTGNGGSISRDQMNISSSHYITSGYTVGTLVTIMAANNPMNYHDTFTGTKVGAIEDNNARGTIIDGSRVLTYGPEDPASFNTDGNTFATRVLDYALLNGG